MSIPSSMQAAILVNLNDDLLVTEINLPKKLDFGQVLVDVHYSGICGSQIGEIKGVKGEDRYLPHLLGHEGAGVVKSIGPNVTRFKEGDHVVMHWRPSSGIQANSPVYSLGDQSINAGSITTFNEFAIVSENRLTKISDEYSLKSATLYGCAITTGFGVIENNANLKFGQSIVVVGAGGVGLNIIQGASLRGANPIIAVDLFSNRLELSESMGATNTVLSNGNESWIDSVVEILAESKADIVVDNTGNPEIITACYELTKDSGKTILVGVPPKGKESTFYTLPLHFGKEILGSHGGNGNPEIDIPRYMNLESTGSFNPETLITKTIDLADVNLAIKDMINGSLSGRCIINCKSK